MSTPKHVAIVGATGAVGVEMIRCLEQRAFPVASLTLLASARSAGKKLKFKGQELTIQELTPESFKGIDIALFSAGGGISRDFAPHAVKAGAVVVDNSSFFRMDPKVPLVVPEINAADVKGHQGIIANPNCTTAISLMALHPLIENAVHYGGKAKVCVEPDAQGCWHVLIADEGPGISEDQFERILAPFYRIDNARARDTAGFGLGIPTADRLLQRFGGKLSFARSESGGLLVIVRVPVATDPA